MTDQPESDDPPHVTVEFVGGPLCGAVVDSRTRPLRAALVHRLEAAARSDRPVEVRLRRSSLERVRVGQARMPAVGTARGSYHRYRLLVELGFAGRVLFRAEYVGAGR